jgi:lipopolysaccharide biosynthesis regulator YciM
LITIRKAATMTMPEHARRALPEVAAALEAAKDRVRAAQVARQFAQQCGDEGEIEIATVELELAMQEMDAALDQFEERVLLGRFRRKRDLPGAHVLPFAARRSRSTC